MLDRGLVEVPNQFEPSWFLERIRLHSINLRFSFAFIYKKKHNSNEGK